MVSRRKVIQHVAALAAVGNQSLEDVTMGSGSAPIPLNGLSVAQESQESKDLSNLWHAKDLALDKIMVSQEVHDCLEWLENSEHRLKHVTLNPSEKYYLLPLWLTKWLSKKALERYIKVNKPDVDEVYWEIARKVSVIRNYNKPRKYNIDPAILNAALEKFESIEKVIQSFNDTTS